MRVQDQLISPRYGGPIIGGIRDFITGAYILTSKETFLSREEFANMALSGGYGGVLPQVDSKDGEYQAYTGKRALFTILP